MYRFVKGNHKARKTLVFHQKWPLISVFVLKDFTQNASTGLLSCKIFRL